MLIAEFDVEHSLDKKIDTVSIILPLYIVY